MNNPKIEIQYKDSPVGDQYIDSRDIVERLNYLDTLH